MKRKMCLLIACMLVALSLLFPISRVLANEQLEEIVEMDISSCATYQSFSTMNNRDFIFLDQANQRIVITNKTTTQYIEATEDKNSSFVTPIQVVQTYKQKYFVVDTVNPIGRLVIYDENLDFVNLQYLVMVANSAEPTTLGVNIPSICIDFYDNAYILDCTQKSVVKYDSSKTSETKLAKIYDITDLQVDSHSKIRCTISGETICISYQNKIYILGEEIQTITLEYTIQDFCLDCSGNIFVLEQDGEQSHIHKLSQQQEELQKIDTSSASYMFIEQENGIMYLINDNIVKINQQGFVANLLTFSPPIDFEENSFTTVMATIALTTDDVEFLTNPYSLTKDIIIPQNTTIIILSENVENSPSFAYCMYENDLGRQLGYIKKTQYQVVDTTIIHQDKMTFDLTKVYKYPTVQSTTLEVLDKDTQLDAILLDSYIDKLGNKFYCVNIDGNVGYIKTTDLISTDLFETQEIVTEYEYPMDTAIGFILIIVSLSLLLAITIYVIKNKIPE